MTRAELEILWAKIRQHLDAAARLLAQPVQPGDEGGTAEAYQGWLENNELELALDELEMVGQANNVPDEYWRELAAAACLMNLEASEARCLARVGAR